MDDTRKALERMERELLKEEDLTLDELLADEELTELLEEAPEPAFDDPEKIHEPKKPLVYNNYANDYGTEPPVPTRAERRKRKNDRVLVGLMITASVLCLGIIGILAYWLGVLL